MTKADIRAGLPPDRPSAMRRQPSDDVRPDTRVSLPSYKNSEVLQCNADLAGVFDERDILGRQRIKERFNRGERCNLVRRVDDRECREVDVNRRTF